MGILAILVFTLQNLQRVEVSFFGLHGRLPLGILLLLVAVGGALIVFAFGVARIAQLRVGARRAQRDRHKETFTSSSKVE